MKLAPSPQQVRISPEEQIETTAERADPESLIGVLQTRDVFADSRVVRVVGQVRDPKPLRYKPESLTYAIKPES